MSLVLSPLKKVRKAVYQDLHPGEEIVAATLVQPPGTMGRQVAGGVGGLAGALVAGKAGKKRREALAGADAAGIAAGLPAGAQLWLGLTPQRMLVWSHSLAKGKPKELLAELPIGQIAECEIDRKRTTYAMVLRFADNSAVDYEVPKVGGDAAGFREAIAGMQ